MTLCRIVHYNVVRQASDTLKRTPGPVSGGFDEQGTHMTKFIFAVLVSFWMIGCGPSKAAMQDQIASLQREIVKLRSERANLDSRASALDDRVLLLKKELGKCDAEPARERPNLEVVRLIPGDDPGVEEEAEEEAEEAEAPIRLNEESIPPNRRGKRPSLVLKGAPEYRPSEAPRSSSFNRNETFSGLGADNLGITGGGQPTAPTVGEDVAMELFNSAYRAYTNKQYAVALEKFSLFVRDYPTHHFADNALFWRGESYLASGQMLRAIGELERMIARYPQSEKVPSALYRMGFVYDTLRDFGKAVEYYFKVVERFPGTDAARRASRRVSEIEKREGNVGRVIPTSLVR